MFIIKNFIDHQNMETILQTESSLTRRFKNWFLSRISNKKQKDRQNIEQTAPATRNRMKLSVLLPSILTTFLVTRTVI